MLTTNFDLSQFLLFNISTDNKSSVVNATGAAFNYPLGTVIGRVTSSGNLIKQISTATDGSQVPIGALAANYIIPAGGTQQVTFVRAGEVAGEFIALSAGDTLATKISDNSTNLGTIGDILAGKGLLIKGAVNLTYLDTQ